MDGPFLRARRFNAFLEPPCPTPTTQGQAGATATLWRTRHALRARGGCDQAWPQDVAARGNPRPRPSRAPPLAPYYCVVLLTRTVVSPLSACCYLATFQQA